jgi:hypothetical protein
MRNVEPQVVVEDISLRPLENPFADPEGPPVGHNEQNTRGFAEETFTDVDINSTDKTLFKNHEEKKLRLRERKLFCCFLSPRTFCIFLLAFSVTFILMIVVMVVMVQSHRNSINGGDQAGPGNATGIATLNGTGTANGGLDNLTPGLQKNASDEATQGIAQAASGKGGRRRVMLI